MSRPPLDYRFDAELVRVNLESALQQSEGNGRWKGRLHPAYVEKGAGVRETALIEHGLKWSPVKVDVATMPRGVGKSSDWRLVVDYLTRAGEAFPEAGVPFTAVLSIEDPDGKPVFNEMRQTLQAIGVQMADIRIAARVSPRV